MALIPPEDEMKDSTGDDSVIDKDCKPSSKESDGEKESLPVGGVSGAGNHLSERRPKNPSLWERHVRENRKTGAEEYISIKEKTAAGQPVRSPCWENCRKKCYEKFTEEDRKKIYQEYRNATKESQNRIICSLIQEENKKTQRLRRNDEGSSRRKFTRRYFLQQAVPEKEVCQKMFLTTFGITLKKARTMSEKMRHSPSGSVLLDGRGRHGKHKKKPPEARDMIKEHISQFPAYRNYNAGTDSDRKYLNPDLTIAQMYRLYKEHCQENNMVPEKESMYRKVFSEDFNLAFYHPSQDNCEKCDTFKASLMTAHEDEKASIEEEKAKHNALAEMVYKQMKADKDFAVKNRGIVTASFHLQKVLPCPMLQTGAVYYKRQLAVYNLSIYETSVVGSKSHCMMWDETIASRGSQEIGSCVLKWMNGLPDSIKEVRLYSDSCGGQSRNHLFAAMLMYMSRSKGIEITHSFLEPGHTHMEADTIHTAIEKLKKSTSAIIEVPRDWMTTIRAIHRKNKLQVTEMQSTDFKNPKNLYMPGGPLMNRHKDTMGHPVNWVKMRVMEYFPNQIGLIMCWTSLNQDASPQELDLRRTIKGRTSDWILPQLKDGPRKLPQKKLKDLMDLLPLISEGSRHFYRSLQAADDDADDDYMYDITEFEWLT